MEMRDRVVDIEWELTGSELVALLLESDEIKKHKPLYNRQQRRTLFQYGLFCSTDIYGYKWLKIKRINGDESPLTSYTNHKEALAHIQHLVDECELCQKLCGLYPSTGACFYHQISKCHGACTGKEPAADYNRRVEEALERYLYHDNNFYLIDQGRGEGEMAVVKVCNGAYQGFGYLGSEDVKDRELLDDCIRPYADNKDIQVIIKGFIRKYPSVKILNFED